MRILSWNILAERRDLTDVWREIARVDPDIFLLQEVEWWAYQQLLDSPLARSNPHEGLVQHAERKLPGWLHARSKPRIERTWVELFEASQTFRGLLCCAIGDVVIATTHMESHPQATALRLAQIDEIDRALRPHDKAILMGDLNFDGGPEEERFHELGWTDVAVDLSVLNPTWDPTQNQLAQKHGFVGENTPLRIDRAYTRGVSPQTFEVGDDGASDHRWVLLELAPR